MSHTTPEHVAAWFDAGGFAKKLGSRASTFRRALVELKARGGRLIVETGAARKPEDAGGRDDGMSTLLFAEYGLKYGAAVVSIDTDQAACALAKKLVREQGGGKAVHYTAICADGAEALETIGAEIGLLYLDSLDFSAADPDPSQEQALREFLAADKGGWIAERGLILVDDCGLVEGGKGGLVVPELTRRGWSVLEDGYQVLLGKEKPCESSVSSD